MGCGNTNEEEEDQKDDNTPGLTQVYFDKSIGTSSNKKILVSNFKIKYTLNKGAKGATSLIQLPMGNAMTNSGYGSVNIWTTNFDAIIDTKKLHGKPISDLLLIEQRIFISISAEDKMMKAFHISNKFEKIFDTELDYSPLKLHGVNLLNEKKKIAITHPDGIVIYHCTDRVSKREDEIEMDEYAKYLNKEENPLIHTLTVEEIMSLFIPNAEISFSVLMNGHSFAFNSLFMIKIWNYKKEERILNKEKKEKEKEKNNKTRSIILKNIVLEERAKLQAAIEEENIKNGKKPKEKAKKEDKNINKKNTENEEEYEEEGIYSDSDLYEDGKRKRRVNPEQIRNLLTLKGHPKYVTSLCSLRDGTLASGAKDKMIFIWDVKEEKIIHYLEGHLGYISALYQLNEGNLVSGDEFCNIIVWSKNFKYKVASIYQDGIILSFYQLINGELFSISSKHLIKIWTFKKSKGKEKEITEEEEKKKKKKKRKKTKQELEIEENYNLKDEDFNDIYKFIEKTKKELEGNEGEEKEAKDENEEKEENEKKEGKEKENKKDKDNHDKRKNKKK